MSSRDGPAGGRRGSGPTASFGLVRCTGGGSWRAVRERRRAVALAWLAIAVSIALATVWALHDPAAAAGVVPQLPVNLSRHPALAG
jgi:hypothetical protein